MRLALPVLLMALFGCTTADTPTPALPPVADTVFLDQGWSGADRDSFYTTNQGSQMMPAAWFAALRRLDRPDHFAADSLARYGYLPTGVKGGLPVGFVVDPENGQLGMTCAACHTGTLSYQGTTWRIDGGRAHADFQQFLTDLAAASDATVRSSVRRAAFDAEVLGASASPEQTRRLDTAFAAWTLQFADFMQHSLPSPGWGAGRLDAFGMIFNRVTARDLGIEANFRTADAPVRYPFLWDAALQDRTQWDGAAPNGTYVSALARNTGEVFGVFGTFHPVSLPPHLVVYNNGVAFRHLQALEERIRALRAPAWPATLPLDRQRVATGARVFTENCASCHATRPSTSVDGAWATPVCRVGTDPRMYRNALLSARSGNLAGSLQLTDRGVLHDPDKKVAILANAVVGSLLLDAADLNGGVWQALRRDRDDRIVSLLRPAPIFQAAPPLPAECSQAAARPAVVPPSGDPSSARAAIAQDTAALYQMPEPDTETAAYEARVLTGIWAAAPYLHNGSVASLWELLTPPAARMKRFTVGTTAFDPANVGVSQSATDGQVFVVDPDDGNSNAGHDYGTDLPEQDRRALLEYLKTI